MFEEQEAVQEKPVDVLIHFAPEAWASLQRSAALRGEEPEVTLSAAIGLLELTEKNKRRAM